MTRHTTSLPPSYFDERYARNPDPWEFATSAYERTKYAVTLNALPQVRYDSALEVGCSIGVLTKALAARCNTVVGLDVAEAALTQARERCRDLRPVRP
ncbi:class I SAM-dependent methyltransferase [Methylobacterium nigriterrae]|uniref:class I SAM-dependent methyltransferase n=1 Tax=Methylobacterium nigriterrae TaxID=3127512 RepID=UPI003013641C